MWLAKKVALLKNQKQHVTGLYDHQAEAIDRTIEYFRKARTKPDNRAALVQLPTGSGKTGIVAVLTRAVPEIRRSLVLAPRVAIRDQLLNQIKDQFFQTINYTVRPRRTELLTKARLQEVARSREDVVFIATIQQVESLHRSDPVAHETLRDVIQFVAMDEGHYEPAPSWSAAIRALQKPTVLLTATPYRNDLRAFRMDESAISTLRFQDAVDRNVIRDVEFVERPQLIEPTRFARDVIDTFEELFAPPLRPTRRIIVRCDSAQRIRAVCAAFKTQGYAALGIHETFAPAPADAEFTRRVPKPHENTAVVWVHQFKLLEGIDDSSFQVVAAYDEIKSLRSLVQQIGRVIRISDAPKQTAYVLDYHSGRHHKLWTRYLDFDKSITAEHLASSVAARVAHALMQGLGQVEYVDRTVREPFSVSILDNPLQQLKVPREVHLIQKEVHPAIQNTTRWLESSLREGDCEFSVYAIDEKTRCVPYISVRNSPYLADTFFLEPKVEVAIVREYQDLIAFFDTGGRVPLHQGAAGTGGPVSGQRLAKLINRSKRSRIASLSTGNTSVASRSLRTRTTTAASIEEAASFFDDFQHAVTAVAGYSDEVAPVSGRREDIRRYLGFVRGRVSEPAASRPLEEYLVWLDQVVSVVESRRPRLSVFNRYCVEMRDPPANPGPRNILIDFSEAIERYVLIGSTPQVGLCVDDSCCDCSPVEGTEGQWSFRLTANKRQFVVNIVFDEPRGKYLLRSEELDAHYISRDSGARQKLTQYLNSEQSFTIVTETRQAVYLHGAFYENGVPTGRHFDPDSFAIGQIMEPIGELRDAYSEKGKNCVRGGTGWQKGSLFAHIDRIKTGGSVFSEVDDPISLVCDDLDDEVADFILADRGGNRVVLIHAKANSKWSPLSASSLQEVCAQAVKHARVLSMFADVRPPNVKKWGGQWRAPNTCKGLVNRRIRLGLKDPEQHWKKLEASIRNPRTVREVWIVLGNMLSKSALEIELGKTVPAPQTFHIVHLLQNTMAAISSMGASLRVYCCE